MAEATEDRSQWRYEEGGPAFEVAGRFVALLLDPDAPTRLDELRDLVTAASWPVWQERFARGFDRALIVELRGGLKKVRHPADGMAYVFWPAVHPDQVDPVLYDRPQSIAMNVVTLLEENGGWRVHELGRMVPPQEIGLEAYSW
jgi:hypothetical protein